VKCLKVASSVVHEKLIKVGSLVVYLTTLISVTKLYSVYDR
jgi:hypothetical protein